jgi:hypothetical protein
MPPTTAHQTDKIITYNKSLCYFKAINSFSTSCFLTTFQRPIPSQRQYSQATTKHSWFKDAALTVQELAAAEEKGETTMMIFTLLQEQHKAQLKLMATANKQAMDAMFECMNALIAGHGKAADNFTATLPNSNTGPASSTTNCNKKR